MVSQVFLNELKKQNNQQALLTAQDAYNDCREAEEQARQRHKAIGSLASKTIWSDLVQKTVGYHSVVAFIQKANLTGKDWRDEVVLTSLVHGVDTKLGGKDES